MLAGLVFTISSYVLNCGLISYSFIMWSFLAPIVIFSDLKGSTYLLSNKKS